MHPRHDFPQPFDDEFSIGQASVARHRAAIAQVTMAKAAPDILTTDDINRDWRAMRVRQFTEGRAEYDRAAAVWKG